MSRPDYESANTPEETSGAHGIAAQDPLGILRLNHAALERMV